MLFTNLNQFIVLGALLLIGWLFGYASHNGGKKWRARYEEESEANAAYRHDADAQLRDSNRRIAELERDNAAVAAQLAETKAAAAAPVAVPVIAEAPMVEHAPPEPAPDPVPEPVYVEPTPAEPVASDVPPAPIDPPHIEPAYVDPAHVEPEPVAAVEPDPIESAPAHEMIAEPAHVAHEPEPVAVEAEPVEPVAAAPIDPAVTAFPTSAAPIPVDEPAKGWFDQPSRDHLARIRGIDGYMQTKLESLGVASFADLEKLSAEDEMALEQRLQVPAGYIAREQWRDQAALLRAGNIDEHSARFAHA